MIQIIKRFFYKIKVGKAFEKFVEHEAKFPNPDKQVTREIMRNFIKEIHGWK